jgi:hypothetical protein
MNTYTHLPTTVEAVQWDGHNFSALADWADESHDGFLGLTEGADSGTIIIDTEDDMTVMRVGDWLVRDVEGRFYPVRKSIFATSYVQALGQ